MRSFVSLARTTSQPQAEDRGRAMNTKPAGQNRAQTPSPRLDWSFAAIPLESSPSPFISPLSRATIQRKLAVNQPGDRYEQEADRVAEQVMRMPDPEQAGVATGVHDSPPTVQRKCSACEKEENLQRKCAACEEKEKLQREEADQAGSQVAPPIVHEVLNSPGEPLDGRTRAFFEPRFGYDFSRIRIHLDQKANASTNAVNAFAYTAGRHMFFAAGQYLPGTSEGNRLLAHELTHVVQQNVVSPKPSFGMIKNESLVSEMHSMPVYEISNSRMQGRFPSPILQRACRSAAQCAAPSHGDAGQFGATVEAESENIAIASGGVTPVGGGPTSCTLPRHGEHAVNLETLATTAGLGATLAPGIAGFFINACLSPNDGGSNAECGSFPGGPPAGTSAHKFCVQTHAADEDDAKSLIAKPKPLNDADQRRFLELTAFIAHESQHNRFDAKAGTAPLPFSSVECNASTMVPAAGRNVESLLSEISAEIGEFNVYFRNSKVRPSRASGLAMQTEEHNIATRGGENILGNIKDLQCVCNCDTVAKFVEDVFNEASSAWPTEEKKEFKKAMTGFLPSFWPRSLHET